MTTFIGLAMSDSMFGAIPSNTLIERSTLSAESVRERIARGVVSCCNPSHQSSLDALKARYGIDVPVPERAPKVALGLGDSLLVLQIGGLPRLGGDRHEYTAEEVAQATFTFSLWTVWSLELLQRLGASTFYG